MEKLKKIKLNLATERAVPKGVVAPCPETCFLELKTFRREAVDEAFSVLDSGAIDLSGDISDLAIARSMDS